MNTLLAAADEGLVSGNADLADILFLVAFIVFVIVAIIRFQARALDTALAAVALAAVALGLFVL